MEEEFIIIASYMYSADAFPLLIMLEQEGIEYFLADENAITANPFLSNAVGGVKVKINSADKEKALDILKQLENENCAKEINADDTWKKDYVKVEAFCPECESTLVYRKKFPWYKTLLIIVLAPLLVPLIFITKKHYCAKCGHSWKQ